MCAQSTNSASSNEDAVDCLFNVGDYVLDLESVGDTDLGVVVHFPKQTISDWQIDSEDPDVNTTADDNPNYNPNEQVILVSFVETGLEVRWPDWRADYPDNLYEGAMDNSVKIYAFPESRLTSAPNSLVAETLSG